MRPERTERVDASSRDAGSSGDKKMRASMLRSYTPADLLTLANASCGTLSIFACLSYIEGDRSRQIWAAFVLPIFALVLR